MLHVLHFSLLSELWSILTFWSRISLSTGGRAETIPGFWVSIQENLIDSLSIPSRFGIIPTKPISHYGWLSHPHGTPPPTTHMRHAHFLNYRQQFCRAMSTQCKLSHFNFEAKVCLCAWKREREKLKGERERERERERDTCMWWNWLELMWCTVKLSS